MQKTVKIRPHSTRYSTEKAPRKLRGALFICMVWYSPLSANDLTGDVEDLGDLQNGVDVTTDGGSHVVSGACFAPAVAELTCAAREAGTHIGITKREDGAFLVDALGDHELEVAVLILGDGQVGDLSHGGIELGEVSTTGLAVEHGHDLHGGLLLDRDRSIARARVTDDANVLVEVDGVHLGKLTGADLGLLTWNTARSDGTVADAEANVLGATYNASTDRYIISTPGIPAKKLGDTVYMKLYARLSNGKSKEVIRNCSE